MTAGKMRPDGKAEVQHYVPQVLLRLQGRDISVDIKSHDSLLEFLGQPGIPFPGTDNAVCANGRTKKLIDAVSVPLRKLC